MSENSISEIVGQDVNLQAELPESTDPAPQDPAPQDPPAGNEPNEPAKEPDSRVVPLAALHEERAKRKELAANIENLRQEQARRDTILEQRLAALQQRNEPQPPSFDENPAAHLLHGQPRILDVAGFVVTAVPARRTGFLGNVSVAMLVDAHEYLVRQRARVQRCEQVEMCIVTRVIVNEPE